MTLSPFHLAIPVHDLAAARAFYGEAFGCAEGRSSEEPAHHTGNGGGDGHARVRDAELVGRVPGARTADGAASSAVEQVSCRASQLWSKAAGRTGRAHHWQR